MKSIHAKGKKTEHEARWGHWWEGRNRNMAWGTSRICLVPGCGRRQWKKGETDDEFYARIELELKRK